MTSFLNGYVRSLWAALRLMLVATVVLGLLYPLVITGISQVARASRADGSLISVNGQSAGSSLIGQTFEGPTWFHPRPSAAGDGYDAAASSGSNLGPNNEDLLALVEERRAAVAAEEKVAPDQVPVDALTASGSGLDPHISPEYAQLQIDRVAAARGLSVTQVEALVEDASSGRVLGFLGDPTVNVVTLNAALAANPG